MTRFLSTTALALATTLALPAMAANVPEGTKLADQQTFNYWILDAIKTLDPQKNTDAPGSDVLRQLFEGLYNDDPKGNPVPGVAESHEVSEDGTVYTFKLRDDAKWSNGDPVTAEDFVYAWRRLADPETASEYAWYIELMHVKGAEEIVAGEAAPDTLGVKALDDHTFEVTLTQPTPYFLGATSHPSLFPVPEKVVEEFGDNWTQPKNLVGNGAYKIDSHNLGVDLKASRNDQYWNNDKTVLEDITFTTVNDGNVAFSRYKAGELDFVQTPSGQFPRLQKERPDETHSVPYACTYGYLYNLSDKGPEALKDKRVRKALSLGINRDVVVNQILQAGQKPAYTWVHWAIANYEMPDVPDANMTQPERIEQAKKLLAEAGYGPDNPLKLDIQYNTDEAHKKIALAVQQFWRAIGVQATPVNYEWKVHSDRTQNQDFDVARFGWCGDYNEPSTFLDYFRSTGYNNGKWINKEYDALLDDAKTAENPMEDYQKAEQLLIEDYAFAPVYQYTRAFLLNPQIKGWPYENVLLNFYLKDFYRTAD